MILGKHSAESLNKMDLNWISGKGKVSIRLRVPGKFDR